MFKDSEIPRLMKLHRTKVSYLVTHALALRFEDMLKVLMTTGDHIVLLFDKSLADSLQKKQLDIHIRIWDDKKVCFKWVVFLLYLRTYVDI